ncbi:reverse transcriptase domain-containing protein [Citrus sinensis]|uniref:uncharacterized protein LOC127900541 n=1 Tax=Citrus sinensis TaxID=2711 RepID=UPI00218DF35D|nr:uncharacterized protein LOC127900541 [Citrus sinensis]KAH9722180.1 reverse transcriptase domain-containing protein [Citrus sinensis]
MSLEASCSDHLPIFMDLNPINTTSRHKRFRFENLWLRERDCVEVITNSWNSSSGCSIQQKISRCGADLFQWGGHLARDFRKRISDCKCLMARLRGRRDQGSVEAFVEARNRYNALLHSHEVFWKQRAKSLWLKEGDRNSRFFHATASARKRRNSIERLRNRQGIWCSNQEEIDGMIVDYFSTLFQTECCSSEEVLRCVEKNSTEDQNMMLLAPFSAVEVKDALFDMHSDKSPGSDGMNPAFYQKFWNIVGEDVVQACLNFINSCSFPVGLNDTSIILIPKKQQPETLADMRPIALCNVLYKIISKMLANRMRAVLASVVSEAQSAFSPGRAITDNIIISAEILHFLKRKRQGKHGCAALKIDMSKAYDRIEWKFLQAIMLRMGFAEKWVDLIMLCVSTAQYNVLRYGKEVGPIIPSRGLRQGDPLSPYLFILCAEGLSSLIRVNEKAGLIHGVKVARSAPMVSHLFFADDSFLFFRANQQEAVLMRDILASYSLASGQKVNFNKYSISFSANVLADVASQVCGVLAVNVTSDHGAYLGLPSCIGRNKRAVFQSIRDKVWQKLQVWNIRLLSRAGKEVLLKTVAQAMPNYVMNVYLLPLDLCKELEIMMNSFWWGGKRNGGGGINWMKWERMCKPKDFGGLGFKQIHIFNVAMLGKQVWKLLTSPTSFVAKVLKARYFPRSSILDANLGFNPSFIWRSIMAAKEVVLRGSRIQIGSGQQVLIGKDPWLPDLEDGFTTSELPEEILMAPVCSLMVADERRWDFDVVTDLFNTRDIDLILKIPLSVRRDRDMWHWLADPGGVFSVRSCYKLMTYDANTSALSFWRRLWKLEVPSKVKNFLWRAATNVLPTYDNLLRRRVQVLPLCVVCNTCNESIIHILVDCGFAKACWIASPIGYIGHISSFMEWLGIIFNRCSKEECELAAMVCWRIWVQRNDKVWNSRCGRVYQTLNSAGHLLHQWQYWRKQILFDDAFGSSLRHGAVCWERPHDGWFKCNVDAAVFSSQSKISFGCVVRNFEGNFLAAKCDCFAGSLGAREAEALGVREALSWLKCLHLPRVIIEVDCLQVFKALTENLSSPNGFGLIIEECRFLAQELGEVQFSFVRRSANVAAHRVARVGGSLSGPSEWSAVPPRWLLNNL